MSKQNPGFFQNGLKAELLLLWLPGPQQASLRSGFGSLWAPICGLPIMGPGA